MYGWILLSSASSKSDILALNWHKNFDNLWSKSFLINSRIVDEAQPLTQFCLLYSFKHTEHFRSVSCVWGLLFLKTNLSASCFPQVLCGACTGFCKNRPGTALTSVECSATSGLILKHLVKSKVLYWLYPNLNAKQLWLKYYQSDTSTKKLGVKIVCIMLKTSP